MPHEVRGPKTSREGERLATLAAVATKKKPKRAAPPRAAAKPRRIAKATTAPAPAGAARAAVLAARMPLVHYPADDKFEDWSDGPRAWLALKSKQTRGADYPKTDFGRLLGENVFFYAGPPCYFKPDCSGDAVLYFDPGVDARRSGGALPFDSGSWSCGPPTNPRPLLQPWRSRNAPSDECWKVIESLRRDLPGWRIDFEQWLTASYDEPDRYIDTDANRHAAGEPDRLDPPEILEHNGTRGYERYKGDCADRRAWTWEIHVEGEVSFAAVRGYPRPLPAGRQGAELGARSEGTSRHPAESQGPPVRRGRRGAPARCPFPRRAARPEGYDRTMSGARTIQATADGALPGIQVIAFHGHLHSDATPGDAGSCTPTLRAASCGSSKPVPPGAGYDVQVEAARPPLP